MAKVIPNNRSLVLVALVSALLIAGSTYYAYYVLRASTSTHGAGAGATSIGSMTGVFSYPWQPKDGVEVKSAAQDAVIVAVAVVREVLPATWTTPDGSQPADVRDAFEKASAHIRTPIRMSVERVLKGDRVGDSLVISVYGGRADGTVVTTSDLDPLKPGVRVLLFLEELPRFSNPPSRLYPALTYVVDGEVAHGPMFDVPLADLIAQLK
ncbi:MAG: hypothetical protein HYY01_03210 [Chloroflexi bacterium]|nr:hypothetical protein [Chloroflexota bacterium]